MATQDTNFERAAPKAHRKMPAEVNILLVLVGIALMFSFNALLGLLQYGSTEVQLAQIVFWMMGSLADRSWLHVAIAAPFMALGAALLWGSGRGLDALTLGEDAAASLGIDLPRLRLRLRIRFRIRAHSWLLRTLRCFLL